LFSILYDSFTIKRLLAYKKHPLHRLTLARVAHSRQFSSVNPKVKLGILLPKLSSILHSLWPNIRKITDFIALLRLTPPLPAKLTLCVQDVVTVLQPLPLLS
ncbi:hypothetical protein AB4520_09200, partial [Vibrio renipiscarius]|uniref:hypothetical protein n=1 Tax=Vibrio renipiscarius TaxID=1461322 RepID=UPI00354D6F3B